MQQFLAFTAPIMYEVVAIHVVDDSSVIILQRGFRDMLLCPLSVDV
jgi:hypothetical protein